MYRLRAEQLAEEMMQSSNPYEWWRQTVGVLTRTLTVEDQRLKRINPQNFRLVGEDHGDFLEAMSTILSFAPHHRKEE